MQFIEIAPNFYLNSSQIVQFRLVYDEARGGYCWVFTLTNGKNLFSIPFENEVKARIWLSAAFKGLNMLEEKLRKEHKEYNPLK